MEHPWYACSKLFEEVSDTLLTEKLKGCCAHCEARAVIQPQSTALVLYKNVREML